MSAIAQLTEDIQATLAPVVLFDTCAILDVARAPRSQSDAASAAMTLIALAKQTPPAIHLLAVDIVRNEWSDNIDSAEKDANQLWRPIGRSRRPSPVCPVNLSRPSHHSSPLCQGH